MKKHIINSSFRLGAAIALAISLTLSLVTSSAQAVLRVRKISGGSPSFADVRTFVISDDSRYIVFAEDREIDGVYGIYSAPLSGGEPVRLTPPASAYHNDASFLVSPDSQWVVYRLDVMMNGLVEVFKVPIAGGTSTRLNHDLSNGDHIFYVDISPDSTRVIYILTDNLGRQKLYSVPIDGSEAALKLSQDLPAYRDILTTSISPDSQHVVYRIETQSYTNEVWYSPLATSNPKTLSGPMVEGSDGPEKYQILPDSSGVVYFTDQEVAGAHNIFRADFYDGINPNVENLSHCVGDLSMGGQIDVTSDSQTVVFSGDCLIEQDADLYKVPVDGSAAPIRLSHSAATKPGYAINFEILPNDQGVIFTETLVSTDETYLYGNLLGSPSITPLLISDSGGDWGKVNDFAATPNSAGVIYTQYQGTSSKSKLYARQLFPILGLVIPLTEVEPANVNVTQYQVSPNSLAVVFHSYDNTMGYLVELYIVPSTGGVAQKINAPLTRVDESVFDFRITPNNKQVVYMTYVYDEDESPPYVEGHLFVVEDAQMIFLPIVTR